MNAELKARLPLLLRDRDYFLLWLSQVFNQGGARVFQIAILWWIVSASGSSGGGKQAGFFLVMGALPAILLAKTIGKTVDRRSSRLLLVGADWLAALVLLVLGVLLSYKLLPLPGAYVAGFVLATIQAYVDPTLNKAVPEVVAPEDVESAVAFQTSTQSLANFGGAVVGALLMGALGIAGVAFLAAATYFISSVCNASIGFRYRRAPSDGAQTEQAARAGWSTLEDLPFHKRVLLVFAGVNFFSTPILVILPLYTKWTLKAGPSVLGSLEAAVWLGLVLGALLAKWIPARGRVIPVGTACLLVFGAALFLPGVIIRFAFYLSMLFVAGLALGINNVKFITLFQETVDPAIKGRFFALMQALITVTFPVAFFLFGYLGDLMRAHHVCLIQGVGVMGMASYLFSLRRQEQQFLVGEESAPATEGEQR